ncbi:MAG: hypothetical protein A2745_01930 [Candidatus Harrisonbacteria bacterium RIFCSPHIGHO2_01_FULL_44_13]|uniref:Uncharacterized protein n=1 Tax=Candidatus Harrisonbacteria bacterium RIFCSPLOWO2_01_FULL_44_18 TaxID=1798407 RepID=A0A1G1ZRE3_9BACT|nr:MAG: hypothetical protein A2745_01930 [Candidatus Harrisonbacteria bacterium RIFCSPHIGHO2_01_FULL_44_13]OGY66320.1 MAG: hypothetical protein A3A16_00205 [Candidatus Harrisonbacteria bacterium RIFCSPLOWO2_01_FULL_44_18]
MVHYKWHLKCCCRNLLGLLLWAASALALVAAWVASTRQTGVFLGLPVAHLFWDSLILGVLALGLKVGKHCGGHGGSCDVCAPGAMTEEKKEE